MQKFTAGKGKLIPVAREKVGQWRLSVFCLILLITTQGGITTSISFRCFSNNSKLSKEKILIIDTQNQTYNGSCGKLLSWIWTLFSCRFHILFPQTASDPLKASEMLQNINMARNIVQCALTPHGQQSLCITFHIMRPSSAWKYLLKPKVSHTHPLPNACHFCMNPDRLSVKNKLLLLWCGKNVNGGKNNVKNWQPTVTGLLNLISSHFLQPVGA